MWSAALDAVPIVSAVINLLYDIILALIVHRTVRLGRSEQLRARVVPPP